MENRVQPFSRFRLGHSAELQGVRALAVASVFLYHIDHSILPGGFLGVDIFFVVSGFLIGRKLLAEMEETGTIALLPFTAARVKRLLPNAILTLLCTAFAAFLFLPSYRLPQVAADIWSAVLIYSNMHFAYNAVDYLQIGEPPSPVLHFWSLSIEEQFYLGLPSLLLLISIICRKRPIGISVCLIAVIMVLSFVVGLQTLPTSQPEAFFLTYNRIWQLIIGVIAGWSAGAWSRARSKPVSVIVLLISMGVLTACILSIDSEDKYPGYLALLPTLATAALLVALGQTGKTIVHRAFAARWSQWIGDRSYSIYLWHWPFIAIVAELLPTDTMARWVAAAVSVIVASIVYERVEKPLRAIHLRNSVRVIPWAGGGIVAVVSASLVLADLPQPADAAARAERIQSARNDFGGAYDSKCHLDFETLTADGCEFGNVNSNNSIMLFGDSHAAHWFNAVHDAALGAGWKFISRTKTSCPSLAVAIWYQPTSSIYEECAIWRTSVMNEIKMKPPSVIVLSNSSGYSGWIAEDGQQLSGPPASRVWEAAFVRLMRELPRETQIWLIRDNPRMFSDFFACLSYSDDCKRPREEAMLRMVDEVELAQHAGRPVNVLDFTQRFCNTQFCPAIINGEIAYRDYHHITGNFARGFAAAFREQLSK